MARYDSDQRSLMRRAITMAMAMVTYCGLNNLMLVLRRNRASLAEGCMDGGSVSLPSSHVRDPRWGMPRARRARYSPQAFRKRKHPRIHPPRPSTGRPENLPETHPSVVVVVVVRPSLRFPPCEKVTDRSYLVLVESLCLSTRFAQRNGRLGQAPCRSDLHVGVRASPAQPLLPAL